MRIFIPHSSHNFAAKLLWLKRVVLLCLVTGVALVIMQSGRTRAQIVQPLHLNVNSLADAPDIA
jgi:hypothetical protein